MKMKKTETIATRSGFPVQVETCASGEEIAVSLQAPAGRRCLLHWGVGRPTDKQWRTPPPSLWPPGTQAAGQSALETPFSKQNAQAGLVIRLRPPAAYESLHFVLFFPDERRWDNNDGRDYQILLTQAQEPAASLPAALHAQMGAGEAAFERIFDVEGQWQLAAAVTKLKGRYQVCLVSDAPGRLFLHWGIARRSPHEWLLPPESLRGAGTLLWQNHTAQTAFAAREGFNALGLEFPEAEAPLGLPFVLLQQGDGGRWLKHRGGNFYIPIQPGLPRETATGAPQFVAVADEIIRAEMAHNSWTLMHRFNLCYDLLDRVRNNPEGRALLYVWLRFSAIRQLTWQRNYNTQPRELAHAQDRLTQKLAEVYRTEPATRPLVRLTLATVGPGGEGQRIRDEILNIMHRRHLKEVSGHFLEEWHQKLHNNTTPDDIVICEAYLEFLRRNGNLAAFYQNLGAGGVTRQRLESFERPIRSTPQFVPQLKDELIQDFQNFLRVLKASHAGTDLETAWNAARPQLEGGLQGLVSFLWEHRNDPGLPLADFVCRITEARRGLSDLLPHRQGLRELLYLDLALEQLLRGVVERNLHLPLGGERLADLIACVLENVTLSYEDPELAACSRHWERLLSLPRFDAQWSLHAKSVVDRIARALSAWIDRLYQLLQPKADYLGRGFRAEAWTVTLFSEEVVRGNSLGFVLSILLRHLDPLLREAAHLSPWQIVSRGRGAGKIEVVDSLRAIGARHFDSPTVIVADKVMGDEEIPEGVTGVIAPDVTDIVSHVAVRARNANLLFASCYDPELLAHLKSMRGRFVHLEVNPAGDVVVQETEAAGPAATPRARRLHLPVTTWQFTKYALAVEEFNAQVVGGKSCHLAQLRGQLPARFQLPSSVAVPFGVFEKALGLNSNREAARRYDGLARQAEARGLDVLPALRQTVLDLAAPPELAPALRQAMTAAALAWPSDWEKAWHCLKQVWASKWNDRAFLSRKKMGIPHEQLCLAVLLQEVVPAEYAFVLHTVNPSTGSATELYGEVVLGLGETLVGNYPGRALGFVWDKSTEQATLLSYPSKSLGLYGSGLIFRSDSNGEDLAGYAGAGLYDSVLLDKPRPVALDYTREPLVWDETFRANLLATAARIGLEIEQACGSPQDIEGAVIGGNYYVVQTRPQAGLD